MILPTDSTGNFALFAAPRAGVCGGVDRAHSAAAGLASGEVTPENMVGLIESPALVRANAASLRTAGEITATLPDAFA